MTRKEFKEMKDACSKLWAETAAIGRKPDWAAEYTCHCPACHIAKKAYQIGNNIGFMCNFCPVTRWRKVIIDPSNPINIAICLRLDSPYRKWVDGCKSIKHPVTISKMRWSWIPEYEKVVL